MMKIYLISALFLFTSLVQAQTIGKKIIITNYPKTVPQGKIWKLERDNKIIVQISEGSLVSGTFCSAMFFSNPGMIFNINKGDYNASESFGIVFKTYEKIPYTNNVTFSLIPISFVDKTFSLNELEQKGAENIGEKELIFKAGESVFVGNCLQTIELMEYNMSKQDIAIQAERNKSIEKERKRLLANFKIPIDPEHSVMPGFKPELKDSLLDHINFSSKGIFYREPGKKFSSDDVSAFIIKLTVANLLITSNNGIYKKYRVLNIKYDSEMRMQVFELGDDNSNHTHDLAISWSNTSKQYSIVLTAVNNSEEYQFQNTQVVQ